MSLILSGTNGLSDVDGSAATPAIRGTDTNTGIFFPAADTVGITTGGTERARVDSSGNLGLGVTPSAWGSGWKALQIGAGANFIGRTGVVNQLQLIANGYFNGTNYIYQNTGEATQYFQTGGYHAWGVAASGSAGGTITFTQAMTLDASGNLGIGTTSPFRRLEVSTTSTGTLNLIGLGTSGAGGQGMLLGVDTTNSYAFIKNNTSSSYGLAFFSGNGLEAARFDSSGSLLVGLTSNSALTGKVSIASDTLSYNLLAIQDTGTTYGSGRWYTGFFNSTAGAAGSIQHTGVTTVNYSTTSDFRLKENIVDAPSALIAIGNVKVRSFDWKIDGLHVDYGFIAQELNEVFPSAVCPGDSEVELVNPKGTWQVDYGKITPLLVKAIQEQQAIITQLQADVAALKGNA